MFEQVDVYEALAPLLVLLTLSVVSASILAALRAAGAKRRAFDIAKSNVKVRAELVKAYRDHKIDDRELKLILRTLKQAIEDEEKKAHRSSNVRAKRFIEDLHPQKSRRVFEDLAREVA